MSTKTVSGPRRRSHAEFRRVLLRHAFDHGSDLVAFTARTLGVTRQAVQRHVDQLVAAGELGATGRTSARKYDLVVRKVGEVTLNPHESAGQKIAEDEVWQAHFAADLDDLPDNARQIVAYGFSEILNNALEHSESPWISVHVYRTAADVRVNILDQGVGVFEKIRTGLSLPTQRDAVLELIKGKVTTDPKRHTGEGIFFTSRACDDFSMLSGHLFWSSHLVESNWLIEDRDPTQGTYVKMRVGADTKRTLDSVFEEFAGDGFSFRRTQVPILVASFGDEFLVSRSTARRVVSRLDQFDRVVLDFKGVKSIGQPFADEIFRVFAAEHPEVQLRTLHANSVVSRMIGRAQQARSG